MQVSADQVTAGKIVPLDWKLIVAGPVFLVRPEASLDLDLIEQSSLESPKTRTMRFLKPDDFTDAPIQPY